MGQKKKKPSHQRRSSIEAQTDLTRTQRQSSVATKIVTQKSLKKKGEERKNFSHF